MEHRRIMMIEWLRDLLAADGQDRPVKMAELSQMFRQQGGTLDLEMADMLDELSLSSYIMQTYVLSEVLRRTLEEVEA